LKQVAVIGAGGAAEDSETWRLAEEVGKRLAEAGTTVVCGGRTGVMAAVARGAASAGGEVIGILPGSELDGGNPDLTHVVATGIGHARNLAVVGSGEVVIAIGGEWGTLSEIGHARAIGRTVVALRSWTVTGRDTTPGSFPVTLAVSALIAVAGVSRMYGACTDTTFDGDATAGAPRQDNATAR